MKQTTRAAAPPPRSTGHGPIARSKTGPPVVSRATTTSSVPAKTDPLANLLLADAGAGQEAMGTQDYAIPRLTILQSLSPQVNKRDEAYLDGAEAGMIFDSVMGRTWDGERGLEAILVKYRRAYIEWIPRNKGGGFVADHGSNPEVLAKCARTDTGFFLPSGNEIVTVAEYFAFILNEDGPVDHVLIGFAKTQLKKARRLNTMISQFLVQHPSGTGMFNPAMFYRTYKLTTGPEQNDKGSWFGWNIEPGRNVLDLDNGEQLYMEARAFFTKINEGKVQVATPVASGLAEPEVPLAEANDAPM